MPEPPKLSGRAVVKAFERDGWQIARQRGSHMILVKEGSMATSQCQIIGKLRQARCEVSFARAA